MAKMDWSFTEDGDIALGAPKVNENNQILYLHDDDVVDTNKVRGGKEGKLIRDLSYVAGKAARKQVIFNRLKTDDPDWYHHPGMGGNLTDLIGEPNTRETGELGVQYITRSLTYHSFLSATQLSVRAVPISEEEIVFFITILLDDDEPYRLPITFNLTHGLKEE
jgi:hypothetical protein